MNIASYVYFVYDEHISKNSWTYESLSKYCFTVTTETGGKRLRTSLQLSDPVCIAESTDDTVRHPLFGIVRKGGWAKMKTGNEMYFCITKSKP
jgi:hypothetical protein